MFLFENLHDVHVSMHAMALDRVAVLSRTEQPRGREKLPRLLSMLGG